MFKLDLPLHETIAERLLKGYIQRVGNAAGDPYVEGGETVTSLPTERPALNADKKTWVGWAVHEGMLPDDAEALTKTDLIEKFGAKAKTADETAADKVAEAEKAEADARAKEAAVKAASDAAQNTNP